MPAGCARTLTFILVLAMTFSDKIILLSKFGAGASPVGSSSMAISYTWLPMRGEVLVGGGGLVFVLIIIFGLGWSAGVSVVRGFSCGDRLRCFSGPTDSFFAVRCPALSSRVPNFAL